MSLETLKWENPAFQGSADDLLGRWVWIFNLLLQILGCEAWIQWGLWSQSHLLQQQITIHDKNPRATTMMKDAMITYSTLHSASKTPEINMFWHLIQLTVHVLGDYSWERKGKAWPFAELGLAFPTGSTTRSPWEARDPVCVDSLGSFHCELVYKICFPVAGKPLYGHDRRELWFTHPEWTQLLMSVHWEGLKGSCSPIKHHLPSRWDKGLCPCVSISSEQPWDSRCLALCPPWVSNTGFSAKVPTPGGFTYRSCFRRPPSGPWGSSPSRTGHTHSAWWRSHSARAQSSSADRLGAKTSKVN